jgi:glycogen debranching enzyme
MLIFLLEALDYPAGEGLGPWVGDAGERILSHLADLQGTRVDDHNEEQPGKIVHEYRDPALPLPPRVADSGLRYVDGRSYAGFDQTFLFVTAYRRFAERFPERAVVADCRSHVESAVRWICDHADADGDGLFEYVRRSPANLLNQVWKDSFDAVTHVGFDVPAQPVAWIDAQGIAFRALVDAAALYASWGDDDRAATLGRRAEALREKIDDAFWLEPDGCYAMALDGLKEPIHMIGSNPGHLLWAGAAHDERVPRLVARLRQQDLWTPYGLRTLSSESPLYAPYAYHSGAIWPFDNAVVVLGLLAVGHADAAHDLMTRVARAVLTIGSPVELYAALDGELFVVPRMSEPALTVRRVSAVGPDGPVPENRNQGWTAAAMVLFGAALLAATSEAPADG